MKLSQRNSSKNPGDALKFEIYIRLLERERTVSRTLIHPSSFSAE